MLVARVRAIAEQDPELRVMSPAKARPATSACSMPWACWAGPDVPRCLMTRLRRVASNEGNPRRPRVPSVSRCCCTWCPWHVWLIGWLIALLWPGRCDGLGWLACGSGEVAASDLSAAMRRTLRDRPDPIPTRAGTRAEDADPLPQPEPRAQPAGLPDATAEHRAGLIPVPDQESQEAVATRPRHCLPHHHTPSREEAQEQVDLSQLERHSRPKRVASGRDECQLERDKQTADHNPHRAPRPRARRRWPRRGCSNWPTRAPPRPRAVARAGRQQRHRQGLAARYRDALTRAILRSGCRPDNVALSARGKLISRQLPGGEVADGGWSSSPAPAPTTRPAGVDRGGRAQGPAAALCRLRAVFQRT